jgi:hypothetical protein
MGGRGNRVSFPRRGRETCYGAQPPFYLVDTGAINPDLGRRGVNRTTRFRDVPTLRIYGDISLLLCIASLRRTYLSRDANCFRINRIPA